ncbi:MAG: hypothetical protein RMK97_05685 [Sutterellaceae bacterium]|nr:hypothetical protein [Burkholderiaceae bacterium]MCX7901890.1 hypothetical protein [Burkholderiaceae bacterium]MDW8429981.1 hypothetical protein [Sutterellaceae bacterium]
MTDRCRDVFGRFIVDRFWAAADGAGCRGFARAHGLKKRATLPK